MGSRSSTAQQTTVNTSTTSQMGDVGFTGQHGVELAAITQAGGVEISHVGADLVGDVAQAFSGNVGQGFSTAEALSGDSNFTARELGRQSFATAGELGGQSSAAVRELGRQSSAVLDNTITQVAGIFSNLADRVTSYGEKAFSASQSISGQALATARDTVEGAQSGPSAQLIRQLPVMVGLGVAAFVVVSLMKRGK